jgi:hypothetical protein
MTISFVNQIQERRNGLLACRRVNSVSSFHRVLMDRLVTGKVEFGLKWLYWGGDTIIGMWSTEG